VSFTYADPLEVASPSECYFYHTTELPGFGTIIGDWDLRDCVDAYLGNYDFSGERALDVGAASGFLTFAMEERGADVVSFDLDDGANWNVVPHYTLRDKVPQMRREQSAALVRLKSAYWLTHRLTGSQAKAYYGNVYSLPTELGEFDVVYYGMIVGHLRDVFEALHQGARLCRRTMIITSIFERNDSPRATFVPNADRTDDLAITSWWGMTTGLMRDMLGVLGFRIGAIVDSEPIVNVDSPGSSTFEKGKRVPCQAIVAERLG
jgi:hypothetical protein